MRIAAIADIHLGEDSGGRLRPAFEELGECADVLLVAGDLTRHGSLAEAGVVARELTGLPVPVLAVLGNHDHHSDAGDEITALLEDHGVRVLEGDAVTVDVGGRRLGVAGVKGFGGGFAGACASEFGEREMKDFVGHTAASADRLRGALKEVGDADVRVAMTHYAPIPETLAGEPEQIYPFLGSYLFGEVIDEAGVDLAVHGHAHFGSEKGNTPAGVPVRNVAQPIIRTAFATYVLPETG
ncbi:metallophosphoesterase family protein [Amycolatopsis suaedae]|uniref:Metallophosphoesterase n=1 Tax=Amycolatopsis suaedae TaxID=2510978 RepID=A0A4Q7J873_9PSEU|nr:metallophosphoesterase [Amycolatopsis suaedae]RZQ63881.1 metallophosphoesterase [Amycolatopsis suaedae]